MVHHYYCGLIRHRKIDDQRERVLGRAEVGEGD
jgi:hypothetical protein